MEAMQPGEHSMFTEPRTISHWPHAGRPLVIAHRGASGYAPENTFAAFQLAVEQGADMVELDVHLSRDGEVVVIHDDRLERTTDGHGLVGAATLAELRRLDAGAWRDARFAGQRIPTLDEVLAWARGRTRLAIEIKNGPNFYVRIEEKVAALLDRHAMLDQALVISFDHHALRRLRQIEPRITTGVLYAARPIDPVALASTSGATVLEPHWSYVTAEDVQVAHAAGLRLAAWATSDPEVLRRLIACGVDGIATDHPDVLIGLLGGP